MAKKKVKKGFYWHKTHHNLMEWCCDYDERVRTIKERKPKCEIPIRLTLFKKVKHKLPEDLIEAGEIYDRTWIAYARAIKKASIKKGDYHTTFKDAKGAYRKALNCYRKIMKKYRNKKYRKEIEILHEKECGCKEWNGKELVFSME